MCPSDTTINIKTSVIWKGNGSKKTTIQTLSSRNKCALLIPDNIKFKIKSTARNNGHLKKNDG